MKPTPSQPHKPLPIDQPAEPRDVLGDLYWSGVRAALPDRALRHALDQRPPLPRDQRLWILALGKAAHPMATAAVDILQSWGSEPAGGLIVAPTVLPSPHPALASVMGDHPLPGPHSFDAAARLGDIVARIHGDDEVWVLLSGGASSLMAAPDGAISTDELLELYTLLLGAGIDIVAMNAIRKRFTRWSGGRLARALHPASVRQYIVSDVIGDDLASIGSGPCVPDPTSAGDIHQRLTTLGLWERVPLGIRQHLSQVEHDPSLETPKPGDAVFRNVEETVIASNRLALDAIAARARMFGYEPHILTSTLAGEAAIVGRRIVTAFAKYYGVGASALTKRGGHPCLIWGGETTVTLPADSTGVGGRNQELALSAARALAEATDLPPALTLLVAGTDGRDGATDAAGAIVDRATWGAIGIAGRDPRADLAAHNSNPALATTDALFVTGLTGTNVMDVVIALDSGFTPSRATAARGANDLRLTSS